MIDKNIKLLSIVALLVDVPKSNLLAGQVGTVVECLAPNIYEVEFMDTNGSTLAIEAIESKYLLALLFEIPNQSVAA